MHGGARVCKVSLAHARGAWRIMPPVSEERVWKVPEHNAPDRRALLVLLMVMAGAVVGLGWPSLPSFTASTWTIALVVTAVGLMVLILVGLTASNMREMRRSQAEINEALARLARGELAYARDVFSGIAERTSLPIVSAVARHNLAWTLMRQGELQRAIDVLAGNEEHHGKELTRIAMHPTSAVDLALDHALVGHLDEAEAWMAKATQREAAGTIPSYRAMKAFSQAVIDCRQGRAAEAARQLDDKWSEYEATATGSEMRPLRVVRAFAHAAAGPRNAGVVETMLAGIRPAFTGELDFLGVAWPEMAAFLASHQLTTTTAMPQTAPDGSASA